MLLTITKAYGTIEPSQGQSPGFAKEHNMENEKKKLETYDVIAEISHWMDGRLRQIRLLDLTNHIDRKSVV